MWARIAAFLRGVLLRRRFNREADEELQFHVEEETAANQRRGMSPADARRAALRSLGGLTQTREAVHQVRATLFDSISQDVRYAARQLRRSPVFSGVAILVFGLGIGLNIAIFSVINAVLLRPVPVRSPHELVYVYRQDGQDVAITTDRDLDAFRLHPEAFAEVTAHQRVQSVRLSIDGESEAANGEVVTANFFDVLGVSPAVGRLFAPADDGFSDQAAIVISADLWRRRFNGDPHVIGQVVKVEDKTFVVIGVASASFSGLSTPWTPSQFWVTGAQFYGSSTVTDGNDTILGHPAGLVARLAPGESLAAAAAVASVVGEAAFRDRMLALGRSVAEPPRYVLRRVSDVRLPFTPDVSIVPVALLVGVTIVAAVVLIIATTNIAGFLMARGMSRTTEMAVRQGLGADGWRLIRQLTTEGLMLSSLGGAVGIGLANGLLALYRAYAPARYTLSVPLDIRVLAFTVAACVGTGLVVSVAPARQALRVDIVAALCGGMGTTRVSGRRLRHLILVPQVGLAMVLLLAAGVQARALFAAEFANLGYDIHHLAVLPVRLESQSGPARANDETTRNATLARRQLAAHAVIERAREFGGVMAASASFALPLNRSNNMRRNAIITHDAYVTGGPPMAGPPLPSPVSPGFFHAMGITLTEGRDFTDRDDAAAPRVAIVSAKLAERLWPGQSPLGKRLASYRTHGQQEKDWLEVIGVVNEVNPVLQGADLNQKVWIPLDQTPDLTLTFALFVEIRTMFEPSGRVLQQMQREISKADPLITVTGAQSMRSIVGDQLYERRTATGILSASGLMGLLLASVGLYGVVVFSVIERKREFGIRTTLGAGRTQIMALVFREGVGIASGGFILGGLLSYWALRFASTLSGLEATLDPRVLAAVVLFIAAVIAGACYLPARRAAKVDPVVVLRGL